jgi:hypothetical protein
MMTLFLVNSGPVLGERERTGRVCLRCRTSIDGTNRSAIGEFEGVSVYLCTACVVSRQALLPWPLRMYVEQGIVLNWRVLKSLGVTPDPKWPVSMLASCV